MREGFNFARQEAFKDLDREISAIKNRMATTGNLQSSSMARAVVDAVLVRFDKVLIAFESSYIGKWADTDRNFPESSHAWLKAKVAEKLDPEVLEVKAQCNSALWEPRITFVAFWQKAEVDARARRNTVFDKIEILRLKKNQGTAPMAVPSQPAPSPQAQPAPWDLMHPIVVKIAGPRFQSGHFADSVEAALKEVNEGKSNVTGYFHPAVKLRILAADRDTTIQDLLSEALNDLFAKHGKPEIAPAQALHAE
ncbi:MAG: ribbon-helix-helix domain-containing protein [Candidatus Acidiferrales bacterium]